MSGEGNGGKYFFPGACGVHTLRQNAHPCSRSCNAPRTGPPLGCFFFCAWPSFVTYCLQRHQDAWVFHQGSVHLPVRRSLLPADLCEDFFATSSAFLCPGHSEPGIFWHLVFPPFAFSSDSAFGWAPPFPEPSIWWSGPGSRNEARAWESCQASSVPNWF